MRLFSFRWKRNRVWSKPRDLRAPAKVFACAGSYVITSPSFPSDLGSGAAALSMCLCGAKLALRLHELLRTAGAQNSSLLRRKHYRDNDRAATVRYERESGDESARRSTSKPSAPRAAALPRPRGRQKNVAASAPREGSFALISCSLDEARDMHEQYEPRDCGSCMRVPQLVSGRRVPRACQARACASPMSTCTH